MKAINLCAVNDPAYFTVGKSKVVWEGISVCKGGRIKISRVCESGGRPFLLGLRYKIRYIEPDQEVEPVNACPYCGDKTCTSDHKYNSPQLNKSKN